MKTMADRMTGSFHFSDACTKVSAIILMALTPLVLDAQRMPMTGVLPSENEVVDGFSVGGGTAFALDEYLSPNEYLGFSIGARLDRMSGRGEGKLFVYSRNRTSFSFGDMRNVAGNGRELEATVGMFHVWETPLVHYRHYDLLAGPSVGGSIDALYNLRNSNNPANVHGWIAVGVGFDSMFRFRVGHLPLALDASVNMPVAGVFFVPEYNLPYYLLFEESLYGKAIHFMNPFNVTFLTHDVSLFVPVGRNQLSLSMSIDYMIHCLSGNATAINHYRFALGYVHRFERKYNGR